MPNIIAKLSEDKKWMHIKIPMEEVYIPSRKTGKTLLVASSHGTHKVDIEIDGSIVRATANAFIPNPEYVKKKRKRKQKADDIMNEEINLDDI
jgi:hypothetical protein